MAKIPAREVPEDYPVPIRTQQALQLNVEAPDGETVAAYLEWPGEDSEAQRASNASGERGDPRASDHVERLLDALGRSHDEFANIYGDRVALDSENGWHGIDAEKTAALRGAKLAEGDDSLDTTRKAIAAAVGCGLLSIPVAAVSSAFGGSPDHGFVDRDSGGALSRRESRRRCDQLVAEHRPVGHRRSRSPVQHHGRSRVSPRQARQAFRASFRRGFETVVQEHIRVLRDGSSGHSHRKHR